MSDYDPQYPCEYWVDDYRNDENGVRLSKPCGQPTIFVSIAAPGSGQGRVCTYNHYVGTCRELTIEDVI